MELQDDFSVKFEMSQSFFWDEIGPRFEAVAQAKSLQFGVSFTCTEIS